MTVAIFGVLNSGTLPLWAAARLPHGTGIDTTGHKVQCTGQGLFMAGVGKNAARSASVVESGAGPRAIAVPAAGDETFDRRETFLPVTKVALMDRLASEGRWSGLPAAEVRRFYRYLDYWRQQQYALTLMGLLEAYEPFSPDSDLVQSRSYSDAEMRLMQAQVIAGTENLLLHANFTKLDPRQVDLILTKESHYGLDLHVDLKAFEEILIYYRGVGSKTDSRRNLRKFGRKEEFEVPIFRRLCIIFKLKPFDARVAEIMAEKGIARPKAERHVTRLRAHLPDAIAEGNVYMKLFKNIPRSDIEMVFPNTQVRFRMLDKVRLGATAGGGIGFGLFTSAGKIALMASNPLAAAGAALGIGGVAVRQAMAFVNQKQKYMVVMAQNLYFHSMADNRGVIVKLASRGAEEDIKEEWLLYSVLAKTAASRADLPAIDAAIERFMQAEFGATVDFDVADALGRLLADGIVTEGQDGRFTTLSPHAAALHIDAKWDALLDDLPDPGRGLGTELSVPSSRESADARVA